MISRGVAAAFTVSAFLSTTLLCQTRVVDWRVYGTFTVDGTLDLLFYDAADVVRTADGHYNANVEGLSTPQIDSIEANESMRKRLVERAALKAKRGVTIPEWLKKDVAINTIVDVLVAQEAANAGGVDPVLRATYAIACAEQSIRVLAAAFAQGDKIDSYTHPGVWFPVKPGSNYDSLLKSVCLLRQRSNGSR